MFVSEHHCTPLPDPHSDTSEACKAGSRLALRGAQIRAPPVPALDTCSCHLLGEKRLTRIFCNYQIYYRYSRDVAQQTQQNLRATGWDESSSRSRTGDTELAGRERRREIKAPTQIMWQSQSLKRSGASSEAPCTKVTQSYRKYREEDPPKLKRCFQIDRSY